MFFIISCNSINILNNITCILVQNKLADLLIYLAPEIALLLGLGGIVICFLSEVKGIFLGHHRDGVLFNGIDNKFFLLH